MSQTACTFPMRLQTDCKSPRKCLIKLAFPNAGVKEMLTCIPKFDEHIFATAKSYMTRAYVFVCIFSSIVKHLQYTFQCYNTFFIFQIWQ